jgi:hypothetical protein
MSEQGRPRFWRRVVHVVLPALAILSASAATRVSAQQASHAAEIARLRMVIDSVEPQIFALKKLDSLRADSIRRAEQKDLRVPVDTIQVGPFTLLGRSRDVRRTRPYAERAWKRVQPMFAGLESEMKDTVIAVGIDGIPRQVGALFKPNTHVVTVPEDVPEKWEALIGAQFAAPLTRHLPASLREWIANGAIASDVYATDAYRALVLGPDNTGEHPARDCFSHDLTACKRALGILPGGGISQPQIVLRVSLVSYAALHSPPGSLKASTNDSSDVVPAIEHLSHQNMDTLLVSWIDNVQEDAHHGFEHPLRYVMTTVFWTAALAALAMRSTRWRLG